jgi:uncharacterized protein (TIGR02466 family)
MNITTIFPETFGFNTLEVDSSKITNYINNLKFKEVEAVQERKGNSFMSLKLDVLEDLQELKEQITKNMNIFLYDVFKYTENFKIQTSWATKTLDNGFSHAHTHSLSFLSGVYYPKGHDSFNIKFYKKNEYSFWKMKNSEFNLYNSSEWTVNVTDNLLILFFSDLKHSIETNNSNETRYSIAFNASPIGKLGNPTSDSQITIV